ncbi:hypothetical protein lbkm_3078 [Lachnospiraceae bacterium KM106-2]|nr:hypothetical protein lbkm_3078 [Lachnospiraceae bacterium KM106-2]
MEKITECPSYTYRELTTLLRNGILLTLFTIDFLSLNYILPFIGLIMINYACFHLRNRNSYYRLTYFLSELRIMILGINLLIDCSFLSNNQLLLQIQIAITAITCALFYFLLDKSFEMDYEANHIKHYANTLMFFIIFYLCNLTSTLLISHIGILGIILTIFTCIASALYIIIELSNIGKELSKTNVLIIKDTQASKKIYFFFIAVILYLLLLVSTIQITNKGLLNDRSRARQTYSPSQRAEQHLSKLGLDPTLTRDLSSKELLFLSSVQSIKCNSRSINYNDGKLKLSFYYCKLKDNNYRIFCYYNWLKTPSSRYFNLMECNVNTKKVMNVTSYSFYKEDTPSKTDIYALSPIETKSNTHGYIYSKFNLPSNGNHIRGYLAFTLPKDAIPDSIIFSYYHQHSILNLPYTDITTYMNDYQHQQLNTIFQRFQLKEAVSFD